jgi:hypothetical protein
MISAMSTESAIKQLVVRWKDAIGFRAAKIRLLSARVGDSTADQLLRGNYGPEPGDMLRGILLDEMAKDGFTLAGDEAS